MKPPTQQTLDWVNELLAATFNPHVAHNPHVAYNLGMTTGACAQANLDPPRMFLEEIATAGYTVAEAAGRIEQWIKRTQAVKRRAKRRCA